MPAGSAAKVVTFECRFQMLHNFVSCGRRGTSWHRNIFHNVSEVALCDMHNTFARFSEDELQVSWQAQHSSALDVWCFLPIALSGLRQVVTTCKLRGARGTSWEFTIYFTLHTLHFYTLYTLHFTLYTPHSTVYFFHSTLYTRHFALDKPHFIPYTQHSSLNTPLSLHSTLCTLPGPVHTTLHSTLNILHSTLCTLHLHWHSTIYTLHFTLDTPHSTILHTLHFILHTLHLTPYTPHSTVCTLHFTFYTSHCALDTPHSTVYTLYSTLYTLHSTLTLHLTFYTLHSALYTLRFTLYTLHFTLDTSHSAIPTSRPTHIYILHSPLNTSLSSHSAFCTPLHSTLHSLHWHGNRGRMYNTVEISCFTKVFYVIASLMCFDICAIKHTCVSIRVRGLHPVLFCIGSALSEIV